MRRLCHLTVHGLESESLPLEHCLGAAPGGHLDEELAPVLFGPTLTRESFSDSVP